MSSIIKRPLDDSLSYSGAPEIVRALLFIVIKSQMAHAARIYGGVILCFAERTYGEG